MLYLASGSSFANFTSFTLAAPDSSASLTSCCQKSIELPLPYILIALPRLVLVPVRRSPSLSSLTNVLERSMSPFAYAKPIVYAPGVGSKPPSSRTGTKYDPNLPNTFLAPCTILSAHLPSNSFAELYALRILSFKLSSSKLSLIRSYTEWLFA